jgi:hypothetical protein
VLSTIGEIVVSLAAPQTQPSGAPASPGAWAMFVDDIWVE